MTKRSTFHLALLLFILFSSLKYFLPDTYKFVIQEDGIAECIQFVFFLISSVYFLKLFLITKDKDKLYALFYLLICLGLIFVSGEEISWGQRILNIKTPKSIKNINYQNEINLHNTGFFHLLNHFIYIIIGLTGGLLWLLPKKIINSSKLLKIFTPHWSLTFYFLLTALLYIHLWIQDLQKINAFYSWKDQEIVETILALAIFLYSKRLYRLETTKTTVE